MIDRKCSVRPLVTAALALRASRRERVYRVVTAALLVASVGWELRAEERNELLDSPESRSIRAKEFLERIGVDVAESRRKKISVGIGRRYYTRETDAEREESYADQAEFKRQALPWIAQLQGIVALNFGDVRSFTDEDLKQLKNLDSSVTIRLSYTSITDDSLPSLTALRDLEHLYLCGCAITDSGVGRFARFDQLRTLDLSQTAITDDAGEHLSKFTAIRMLALNDTCLTDKGITLIGLAEKKKLRSLSVANTAVSAAILQELAGHPSIQFLDLSGTGLTDEGCNALVMIPKLEELVIKDTNVSDSAIDSLSKLKGLQGIWIRRSSITWQGVERLRAALPKCDVLE
jgi:hypothetical protein